MEPTVEWIPAPGHSRTTEKQTCELGWPREGGLTGVELLVPSKHHKTQPLVKASQQAQAGPEDGGMELTRLNWTPQTADAKKLKHDSGSGPQLSTGPGRCRQPEAFRRQTGGSSPGRKKVSSSATSACASSRQPQPPLGSLRPIRCRVWSSYLCHCHGSAATRCTGTSTYVCDSLGIRASW
jgi:hypothetical protein